jgi:hypothetical protein
VIIRFKLFTCMGRIDWSSMLTTFNFMPETRGSSAVIAKDSDCPCIVQYDYDGKTIKYSGSITRKFNGGVSGPLNIVSRLEKGGVADLSPIVNGS